MKTFIYTLEDPITGEIRYVGKANSLKSRLYGHIIECNRQDRKTHKINWIKSLLEKGMRPIISILDEVPGDEWEYWERYWIQQLNQWGTNLTNISSGGFKGNNYKRSSLSKDKMKISKKGIKLSDNHRLNISKSQKERHKEFPKYNLGPGNSRIHLDKELLYHKYITENLSIPKCSKFFNVSEKTIFTNLKEYNIQKDKSIWKKQLSTVEKIDINQYDINGNFIKEWHGATTIEKDLGIRSSDILMCCNGRINISHGYIWRLKGDTIIHRQVDKSKSKKPVIQLDKHGNVLNKYESLFMASKITGISRTQIGYCCKGVVCKSAGGFVWKYS